MCGQIDIFIESLQYLRQTHLFHDYLKHGEIIPTLQFCHELVHEMLDDIIGIEVDINDELPRSSCTLSILLPCEFIMVMHNQGTWG